jgi:aryl-alcohol dehydrogenase-like predicted oxidoreductase
MGIRDLLVNGPLGFGTAPLGNMFRDIPDHEAEATVDAAWDHGTRFFDTAPMYGAGLAEIRLGKYLAQHDRDDYMLSTNRFSSRGGQAAVGDVREGNPRAIWRSLMRVRSAIGVLVGLGVGGKCLAQLLDRGLHGL